MDMDKPYIRLIASLNFNVYSVMIWSCCVDFRLHVSCILYTKHNISYFVNQLNQC